MANDIAKQEPKFKGTNPNTRGRKPGVVNRQTRLLKDCILMAAEEAGGRGPEGGLVGYLKKQALENPTAFLSLLGKVIPLHVQHAGQIEHVSKEQRDAAVRNALPMLTLVANKAKT